MYCPRQPPLYLASQRRMGSISGGPTFHAYFFQSCPEMMFFLILNTSLLLQDDFKMQEDSALEAATSDVRTLLFLPGYTIILNCIRELV